MRIKATDFNGKDVRISVEAENEAELYQLQAIKEQLDKASTNWQAWNDMEGRSGIVIVAEKRSNVEFSGGAPLYGAASAGTQGYASAQQGDRE